MFANINDCYLFANFLANKLYSGSIAPSDFSLTINVAQQQYFRTKLGLPEMYTVDKREAPQEIQVTQSIDDSLRPFIKSAAIIKSGNGFNIPSDFAAFVPSGYLYVYQQNGQTASENTPIDFVSIGERANRLNNYVIYPTVDYPIATYLNSQIIVDPSSIGNIELMYYRYPVTPIRNYTVNANDQDTYDPSGSVQLEFPNLDWENICHIAVKYWAINIREEALYNAEDSRIKSGQ